MQTIRPFTSSSMLYSDNLEPKVSPGSDHHHNHNQGSVYSPLPQYNFATYDATRYRKWVSISPKKSDLSIMSFNLLSRHYTWHLRSVDKKYLDWATYRFPLINQTISQLQSDIMCLQEVEYLVYKLYWSHNFPNANYTSHYAKKTLPDSWGMPLDYIDGVAVFVNTQKFDVLDKKEIHFANHISSHKDEFELTEDLQKRMLPRNTVALIVKLYDKVAHKTVYVANTHLYWSPQYNDVKTLQMKLLLNELNKWITEEDAYVLLAGDLNSTLHSSVIRILSSTGVNVSDCWAFRDYDYGSDNCFVSGNGDIKNPFDFQNVYAPLIDSNTLKFTSHTTGYTGVLDHIFASKIKFEVTKLLGGVDKNYAAPNGFPDAQFPSDHIPIAAEISYI
ncbi:Glucose-repressible alcohol dehydrogenase transcriptional effector [Candida viswanathii]|uniref:Glucose-repressible alcohol dehydrogenase transcriptional effector n=1 Tax=Candida viswanathii TaxID=5486 RepID=A0A367YEG3_9ASCO|nr:Glucose-repressible alcohol dehydrogenase transcriptional effector [Candida viswanathii]